MKNEEYRSEIALTAPRGKWTRIVMALIGALLLPTLAFSAAPPANRWLLIFDTSSSMRNRSKSMEDTVQDLLSTGMHGQIHHGDTIGIWTFSERLHTGEAPLQVWEPDKAQMIVRHTLEYLDTLRYGKSGNLEAALTNMYAVVDSSDFITVILFSDGDQLIKGTPFDDEINQQYKDNYRQERKAEMPIITVFQAKGGNFTTNTVNFGPWPIEIPAVPRPPAPKPPVEPPAAPKPPPPPPAPPIIFDGRKSQSDAPDNTTLPVATNVAEIATPAVTQPTAAAPTETPAANQPATAPAAPPAVAETPPPATPAPAATPPAIATAPPAETAANNRPEEKAATPVAPPIANESQPPPPAAPMETRKAAATPPPIETATSVPPANLLSTRNLAIASIAFAAIVCGFLLMAARNARKTHSSLITRSLDREQRQ